MDNYNKDYPVFITPELAEIISINPQLQFNVAFNERVVELIKVYQKECSENFAEDPEETIKSIYKSLLDAYTKKALKEAKIQCRRGCSFCCHVNVGMTDVEAVIIAKYCRDKGIQIPKEYLVKQLQFSDTEIPFSPVSKCVFLKNGECSIYDVRPLACRRHFVNSDPKFCNYKLKKTEGVKRWVNIDAEIFISAVLPIVGLSNGRLPQLMLPYAQ